MADKNADKIDRGAVGDEFRRTVAGVRQVDVTGEKEVEGVLTALERLAEIESKSIDDMRGAIAKLKLKEETLKSEFNHLTSSQSRDFFNNAYVNKITTDFRAEHLNHINSVDQRFDFWIDNTNKQLKKVTTDVDSRLANVHNDIMRTDELQTTLKAEVRDDMERVKAGIVASWLGVAALGALGLGYSIISGIIWKARRKREEKKLKEIVDGLETVTALVATRLHARDWKPVTL